MGARRELLSVDEVKGAWAIIPTPAKEGASDWRSTNTVDLDETARAVEGLIDAGIDGLLTLGTLGECGALSWEEKKSFLATVVETARGRIPVFGGTTTLSTRQTVEETKAIRDLGVDGTMVGPAMWNKPDIGTSVQFFRDLGEAVPDMAICVYANPFVFKFEFPTPFWAQVADIPQLVCAKIPGYASLLRDIKATKGRIRLMPIDSEYYGAVRLAPEHTTAFWSSGASCGPAPTIALRDAVEEARKTGDWSKAQTISEEMSAATLPIIAYGDFNTFQMHNVTLEKGRMDAAGWMKAGPNRPPYHITTDQAKQYAKLGGEMWAELHKKYSKA